MNITVRAHRALHVVGVAASMLACSCLGDAVAADRPAPVEHSATFATQPSNRASCADCEGQSSESSPVPMSVGPMMHAMEPGETLRSVARRYRCPLTEVVQFNRSNPYLIPEGQILTIPNCSAHSDGRWSVAREITVDPTPGKRYRMRSGESMERLGLRTGCTAVELMEANRYDEDAVFTGGLLEIPECSGGEVNLALSVVPSLSSGYLVSGADSLGGIAQYTGCSRRAIRRANGLKDFYVEPGTRLQIPDCTNPKNQPREQAGRETSGLNTRWLKELMQSEQFRPPKRFKALITIVDFEQGAQGRTVRRERRFAYGKTADDVRGWNPASTVKLFSAVAALRRLNRYGFTPQATVEIKGRKGPHIWKVEDLVREALVPSNNIAHNHLVQLAGFDYLNKDFLSERNGFRHSAILRAYATRAWREMGEASSLRETPPLVVREGDKTRSFRGAVGSFEPDCEGACTSLLDLSESLRRVMLDELPRRGRYGLPEDTLRFLQETLSEKRTRGDEVVDRLAFEFNDTRLQISHKAGFSRGWYSDVAYMESPDRSQAYVIALAGYPGRSSLGDAAAVIGTLLATGRLR